LDPARDEIRIDEFGLQRLSEQYKSDVERLKVVESSTGGLIRAKFRHVLQSIALFEK